MAPVSPSITLSGLKRVVILTSVEWAPPAYLSRHMNGPLDADSMAACVLRFSLPAPPSAFAYPNTSQCAQPFFRQLQGRNNHMYAIRAGKARASIQLSGQILQKQMKEGTVPSSQHGHVKCEVHLLLHASAHGVLKEHAKNYRMHTDL
eukprot:1161396-Pelagomonas_calceolata.AAC.8